MTAPAPSPEERLAALGLELPSVPPPLAAYVPAVAYGGLAFSSGQLPSRDGRVLQVGKVGIGADVTPERAAELAAVCALNALAALASVLGGLGRIERVVKVVGFVASAPGFTGQPQVIDGASRLIVAVLGDAGVHARSAVGVSELPLGAPVEVEVTCVAGPARP